MAKEKATPESQTRLTIRVDFACNDEHGNYTGKAEAVHVGDLELQCQLMGGGVSLREECPHTLYVGKLKMNHYGRQTWVGNWCWDAWWMNESDLIRLIEYLERQKYWHCESGPCDQYDKFNSAEPFTTKDIQDCL